MQFIYCAPNPLQSKALGALQRHYIIHNTETAMILQYDSSMDAHADIHSPARAPFPQTHLHTHQHYIHS